MLFYDDDQQRMDKIHSKMKNIKAQNGIGLGDQLLARQS